MTKMKELDQLNHIKDLVTEINKTLRILAEENLEAQEKIDRQVEALHTLVRGASN